MIENGVWWIRDGVDTSDEMKTNIPHRVKHHSPTGMNVGYGGGGPADFALNILQFRLEQLGFDGKRTKQNWSKEWMFEDLWGVYQTFKRHFLADADILRGGIDWQDVNDFLRGCDNANIRAFMHGEDYEHQHICKAELMEDSGEVYTTLAGLEYPIYYCGECFEEHILISSKIAPNIYTNLAEHRRLVKDIYGDE